jgi:hypothetical protein
MPLPLAQRGASMAPERTAYALGHCNR